MHSLMEALGRLMNELIETLNLILADNLDSYQLIKKSTVDNHLYFTINDHLFYLGLNEDRKWKNLVSLRLFDSEGSLVWLSQMDTKREDNLIIAIKPLIIFYKDNVSGNYEISAKIKRLISEVGVDNFSFNFFCFLNIRPSLKIKTSRGILTLEQESPGNTNSFNLTIRGEEGYSGERSKLTFEELELILERICAV